MDYSNVTSILLAYIECFSYLNSFSTYNDTYFDTYFGYYAQPWVRALPYIWGILFGYILFKLRGKKLNYHWVIACLPIILTKHVK